ncbi:hypothetical protein BaRGS_00005780, partial [Batillaria attramentaria]
MTCPPQVCRGRNKARKETARAGAPPAHPRQLEEAGENGVHNRGRGQGVDHSAIFGDRSRDSEARGRLKRL